MVEPASKGRPRPFPSCSPTYADPIGTGHVASLNRPGGNITGLLRAGHRARCQGARNAEGGGANGSADRRALEIRRRPRRAPSGLAGACRVLAGSRNSSSSRGSIVSAATLKSSDDDVARQWRGSASVAFSWCRRRSASMKRCTPGRPRIAVSAPDDVRSQGNTWRRAVS